MDVVKKTTYETCSEEVNRIVDEMSLMDDDLMSRVFEDNIPATELLLETILEEKVRVTKSVGQMEMQNPIVGGRNITLDIYANDENGRKFNCKVQRRNSGADPKRVRFHAGMLDTRALLEKEDFKDIRDTYVVFITEKDYYKRGKAYYRIERKVDLDGELVPFSDGNHIIYVNGSYIGDDPIGRLMEDFRNQGTDGFNNPEIEKAVRHYKVDEGGRQTMCEAVEKYGEKQHDIGVNEGRAEGHAEGHAEGLAEGRAEGLEGQVAMIRNLMQNLKFTAEQAMDSLGVSMSDRSKYMAML